MNKIIFLFSFLWMCTSVLGQTITIKDKETKLPLSNISVSLDDDGVTFSSNNQGQILIPEDKTYSTLTFRNRSYKPLELNRADLTKREYIVYLEHAFFTYDEIVVSVNKSDEVSNVIPQAVTTISEEDVALENPQNCSRFTRCFG